jgi:hypothetical protein
VLFTLDPMLSCFHPLAGPALVALALASSIGLAAVVAPLVRSSRKPGARTTIIRSTILLLSFSLATLALTLWLASYAHSPLAFAREPVLRGFLVQKQGQPGAFVPLGQGFSIVQGSAAEVTPILKPPRASCSWQSRAGAMLDSPDQCDIAYMAPAREYDRLHLAVASRCGLGRSTASLSVQILAP